MMRDFSFQDAIELFQSFGFTVTPGPSYNEVTLAVDHSGGRTYCDYPARDLCAIAGKAIEIRTLRSTMKH